MPDIFRKLKKLFFTVLSNLKTLFLKGPFFLIEKGDSFNGGLERNVFPRSSGRVTLMNNISMKMAILRIICLLNAQVGIQRYKS